MPAIDRVASGRNLIVWAILLMFPAAVLQTLFGNIAGLAGIAAIVLALVGLLRLASGLGFSLGLRILVVGLMFVPVVNLLVLFVLNARAINALRAAGYKPGIFAAKPE